MSYHDSQAEGPATPLASEKPEAIPDTIGGRVFTGCFVFLVSYVAIFVLLFLAVASGLAGNTMAMKETYGVLVLLALILAIYVATRP